MRDSTKSGARVGSHLASARIQVPGRRGSPTPWSGHKALVGRAALQGRYDQTSLDHPRKGRRKGQHQPKPPCQPTHGLARPLGPLAVGEPAAGQKLLAESIVSAIMPSATRIRIVTSALSRGSRLMICPRESRRAWARTKSRRRRPRAPPRMASHRARRATVGRQSSSGPMSNA